VIPEYFPLPGVPVEELDTPALLVDLDVAEANIRKLQATVERNGSAARPHVKTHKSPFWAEKQIAAGAVGVCVAKVGEAEALVAGGIQDILIANEVRGRAKIMRLMSLAARADMIVAVDDPESVRELSEAAESLGVELGVVVEVNVRMDRCGVEPGEPTTTLAGMAADAPGLRFEGLMGYEGHVSGTDEERRAETLRAMDKFLVAKEAVEAEGLDVRVMTAGGTSTYDITSAVEHVTDVQCGSYIFMDGRYLEEMGYFESALSVLTSVMSRPAPDRVVLDLGRKSVGVESGLPILLDAPGLVLDRLNLEHGVALVQDSAGDVPVGTKLRVLPMCADTTVNVHSHYFCVREGKLEAVVEVAGRGMFR